MNLTHNILGEPIKNGVSVINAIKNRNEHLNESLQTWVDNPIVDEIIIVDWCSKEPVETIVNKFKDKKKIIIVRVENEDEWVLSYAYNLALQFTSKTKILKLDADIKLHPDFFNNYNLRKNTFFTGRWELARDTNEIHLNGVIFAFRKDIIKVKGYDERLTCYGWDDSDLYERLENNLLTRNNIKPNSLSHIPHGDNIRVQHQVIDEAYKDNLLELTIKNKDLSLRRVPWGLNEEHTLSIFTTTKSKKKPDYHTCIRKRARLFIDVKGSLRERLRDYLIAKDIAEKGKRDLQLIWQPNSNCEFKFSELFKNDVNVVDTFDMNALKKNTEFFILSNNNFSPREISLQGNNDILIRASDGFCYEDKYIKPLRKFPIELKQILRKSFQTLIPRDKNKTVFDKNLIIDILRISEPKTQKVEEFLEKKQRLIVSKDINNFDYLIKSTVFELKNYIEKYELKSLIMGVSGDVDSLVSAFLCRKVCRELNMPLITRTFVMGEDDEKNLHLPRMIGNTLTTNFKKVDLSTDYKVFCRGLKSANNFNFKSNNLETKVRGASIKARLRMIYLYDLAQAKNGKVISTINQTDFLTGLWTLHGDVGDFYLLQSLWKTEIYTIAKYLLKKYVKNPKERKVFIKCIKAIPRMSISISDFSQLNVKSYEDAEQVFKRYFSGTSELNSHPLIQRYKKNYTKLEGANVLTRTMLLKSKNLVL